jgi:hypothetical protein
MILFDATFGVQVEEAREKAEKGIDAAFCCLIDGYYPEWNPGDRCKIVSRAVTEVFSPTGVTMPRGIEPELWSQLEEAAEPFLAKYRAAVKIRDEFGPPLARAIDRAGALYGSLPASMEKPTLCPLSFEGAPKEYEADIQAEDWNLSENEEEEEDEEEEDEEEEEEEDRENWEMDDAEADSVEEEDEENDEDDDDDDDEASEDDLLLMNDVAAPVTPVQPFAKKRPRPTDEEVEDDEENATQPKKARVGELPGAGPQWICSDANCSREGRRFTPSPGHTGTR